MKSLYSILLMFFLTLNMFAQTDSAKYKFNVNYIGNFSDKLTLFTYGKTKFVSVAFKNNRSNKEVIFSPNNNFNLGFGFIYKWIGLAVAFNVPYVNNDNNLKGKTNRFDAQMNLFTQKFVYDFYFSHYKGFYVANPRVTDSTWVDGIPYPQLPNFSSNNLGLSVYYILNNKKFSIKAPFGLNQIQKKSAGSWIFGFVTKLNSVKNDTNIIPENIWQQDSIKILAINDLIIGPLAGYGYNFVIKKNFLISISVVPGILYTNSKFIYEDKNLQKSGSEPGLGIGVNYKFGIIYNKENFFAGFNLNNLTTSYSFKEISKTYNNGNYRLFVGYRFNVKKNNRKFN